MAALRKGRDPRMNEQNTHFDKLMAMAPKENQGFNIGRHERQRPTTAVLAWRPEKPFLTYEKKVTPKGEVELSNNKLLHAKIMNDRVMENNLRKFVPSKEGKVVKIAPVGRSQSCEPGKALN